MREKEIELRCFKGLQGNESIALPQRLSQMTALVNEQKEREAAHQAKYAEVRLCAAQSAIRLAHLSSLIELWLHD